MADATLRTPIAGTAVHCEPHRRRVSQRRQHDLEQRNGLRPRVPAGSGSSSPEVALEPLGKYVVAADATTAQIAEVEDGEQAIITPTGSARLPMGWSPVQYARHYQQWGDQFPDHDLSHAAGYGAIPGASAIVELVTRDVANVLVVPTSAVHTEGTTSYVYLLKGGKEVQQTIGVGAVGTSETQVTSGLKSGQEVVIASLSARVPSSGSSSSGFSGRGGFGGGGFGGGFVVRAGG